jgi:hypothetical protein
MVVEWGQKMKLVYLFPLALVKKKHAEHGGRIQSNQFSHIQRYLNFSRTASVDHSCDQNFPNFPLPRLVKMARIHVELSLFFPSDVVMFQAKSFTELLKTCPLTFNSGYRNF